MTFRTDVNGDGHQDLITAFWIYPNGGWPNWAPIVIYPGNNLFLNNAPTWWSIPSGTSNTNSVVESIKVQKNLCIDRCLCGVWEFQLTFFSSSTLMDAVEELTLKQ